MQDILQQITLPASRDSQAAFETSAEELIRRHRAVLGGRSHAIRLAVDLLSHHLLPEDLAGGVAPGLATLTFYSSEGSVQQLVAEFACPGSLPAVDAAGKALLGEALRTTIELVEGSNASVEVRLARRSGAGPFSSRWGEGEIRRLRDAVWLVLLARSWRNVSFHPLEAGRVSVRLQAPKPVPRRAGKRPSA